MTPRLRPHPGDVRPTLKRSADADGGAAVEFAVVAPVLLMLLFGILMYGGYFLMSHSIQQLANDAARAAVGGMTDAERRQLAQASLSGELPTYGYLSPASAQLTYTDTGGVMTVAVAYDASSSPLWALNGVIPMPSSAIVRSAAVQVGGF